MEVKSVTLVEDTIAKFPDAVTDRGRKHVEHLGVDRPLYDDHNKMKYLVESNEIIDEIENCIGSLH